MKLKMNYAALIVLCLSFATARAQNKIYDYNTIVWVQNQNTVKLHKNTSAHIEYNWRRVEGVKSHGQTLLRVGINQKINDQLMLHIGYAYALTHVFGDYPIANNGNFPERRIYQQVNLKSNYKKLQLLQRARIEQRWVGVMNATTQQRERWNFVHRFRYMLKAQYPLPKNYFVAAMDEIFIGAGKNLGVNIFDQNRILLSVGKKLNKNIGIEIGYFNLVQQQGRLVNNKIVVQRNNGILATINTNF